ncbi:amidohydrolase [Parvularcula flava]|uniref:Amidohydrolase n=1 Tax=Aquisalinus luteolus TaxID=1566827 RepID=A0A8J3EP47_9PROT|nr:amidohydrolase [Aquisalinus luteolus]NHK27093.1 amidohydrolase [Aquisalinus luteolus]GGH94350.1 putative amidohydrolase [Aquisalinus luteolus]
MRHMLTSAAIAAIGFFAGAAHAADLKSDIAADYGYLDGLYKTLHANPELSFMEVETARRMAAEFRKLGFDVTEGVGKTGVVGVMRNGEGPVVTLRADMDGLPVTEQTGLAYASTATGENRFGEVQPIMHACGHDIHMTSLIGAARQLVERKGEWSGTLILIAQPAEEIGLGARAMLDDGLYERFPRPDYVVALHDSASLPAGKVAYTPGWALANVDSVDIYVKGVGGHGAYPQTTKDPVVVGASIVTALQTLVSREVSPLEPAVVTVGAFNAGAKHNIISDEAHLQLTVRSYTDEVRAKLLDGIQRIARAQAASVGLPEELYPRIEIEQDYTPSTYNDPELADRLANRFVARFGADNVIQADPVMGGEDFAWYGRLEPKIPTMIFWIGAVSAEKVAAAQAGGEPLPSLHSPFFAPQPRPTILTGVEAMTAAALDLLQDTETE